MLRKNKTSLPNTAYKKVAGALRQLHLPSLGEFSSAVDLNQDPEIGNDSLKSSDQASDILLKVDPSTYQSFQEMTDNRVGATTPPPEEASPPVRRRGLKTS